MSNSLAFNFQKTAVFSFAVLVFCFFSEVSFAQENMGKVETDILKPIEKPIIEGQPITNEANPLVTNLTKNTPASPKVTAIKKENGLIGEGKKPETSPPTPNFNIFLYIVDKFKAD